jgi:excisionase family DNA binding protein
MIAQDTVPADRLLLTVEQAASVLGISPRQIFYLLDRHELHGVRIGRSRRIPREDLTLYVEKLRREAAEERPILAVVGRGNRRRA